LDGIVQAAGDMAIRLHVPSRHPWAGSSVMGSYKSFTFMLPFLKVS
jgi:hypothetical protein